MKRFSYKAKESATGKVVKGTIQAESERAAGKLLMDMGYVPESVKDEADSVIGKRKASSKDRITFTRSFATLIGAGLPLAQSLRTVSEQTPQGPMRTIIEEILADIESGKSLGDAFAKHPETFNNVYLSLIRAGEVSGTLDNSLKRIAEQEEKDQKNKNKIMSAMMYPAIAMAVIFAVFMYMMLEVTPHVVDLYETMDTELPILTQILVGIKDFILQQWLLTIIVVAVIVIVLGRFFKTDAGIEIKDNIKLHFPMFNELFKVMYMARFTRISQILLSTGVAVLDTLKIAGNAVSNVIVEKSVLNAAEKVKSGKPLSVALTDQPYILPMVIQMAAIGEQSGKMDEMLGKAAQIYEEELEAKIAAISTMIEPLLMIMLAGMAGVLVGGVLFPIYSIVNEVG